MEGRGLDETVGRKSPTMSTDSSKPGHCVARELVFLRLRHGIQYNCFIVIINFARRAHDHNWELDPITRSLLDTDFYKLLMLQFIWKHFPATRATFTLINRTVDVPPRRHRRHRASCASSLKPTRKLRFHKSELIWLAGNTFYGRRGIFEPAFLEWLERDFRLSDYELSVHDGQISLRFRRACGPRPRCGRSTRSPQSPS